VSQLITTILVALFIGLTFYQVSYNLDGIQNRAGLLFFTVVYFSLVSISSIGTMVTDRVLFLRERGNARRPRSELTNRT